MRNGAVLRPSRWSANASRRWSARKPGRTFEPYFRDCLAGKTIKFELEVDLAYRPSEPQFRVFQRRAYGLRDEEYLRLKVLACMLPPL